MRWNPYWTVARDIVLTGTGIFVILSQVYSSQPKDVLLYVALGLTAWPVTDHAKALMSGPTDGSRSPQPPLPQPPPSSPPSPEVPGE